MANRDKKQPPTSGSARNHKEQSSTKHHVGSGVTVDFTEDLKQAQADGQNKQL